MDARSRPAYVGFNLYRDSAWTLTLDDINLELEKRDLRPIAERTFTHFERLHRYGFERYITINQFDVAQLRDPLWNASLRKRYRLQRADAPMALNLLAGDDVIRLGGNVTAVSAAEASLVVPEHTLAGSQQTLEELSGVLEIAGESSPIVVDLAQVEPDGSLRLDVAFLGLVATHGIVGNDAFPAMEARLTLNRRESIYLADTVRGLYLLFQLIDSIRIACDDVMRDADPHQRFSLEPPRVVTLSKASPTATVVEAALPVVLLLGAIVTLYNRIRIGHYKGTHLHAQADVATAQAGLIEEQTRALRQTNDLRERFVSALDVDKLAQATVNTVTEALRGQGIEPIEATTSDRLLSIVRDEVVPSAAEIVDIDLESIEMDAADVEEFPSIGWEEHLD